MQRFWAVTFLAQSVDVSSSEEQARLFRHSCSECYLVGWTGTGVCLWCKHGHDASVATLQKKNTNDVRERGVADVHVTVKASS